MKLYFLLIVFVHQKAFTPVFKLKDNLCEFTTREQEFKRRFYIQKLVWNTRFKDFCYTKINLSPKYLFEIVTQIIYYLLPANKSKNTLHLIFT